MRSAHVVIVTLTGAATEIIKNIVLAGIGRLTIIDDENVVPEDLSAGFFFRDSDIGSLRTADAPLARIQELNPLVKVGKGPRSALQDLGQLEANVVVASGTRDELIELNALCRAHDIMFYATDVIGTGGYMFSDLGSYDYIVERGAPAKETTATCMHQEFVSLADSLAWTELGGTQRWSPGLWGIWAMWERLAAGPKPDISLETYSSELEESAMHLLVEKDVNERSVFGRRSIERGPFFSCVSANQRTCNRDPRNCAWRAFGCILTCRSRVGRHRRARYP